MVPIQNNNPTQQNPKKQFLHHLMQKVLNSSVGKGIHETVSAINAALAGYKNYAKEWDGLHGMFNQSQQKPQNSSTEIPPEIKAMQPISGPGPMPPTNENISQYKW